MTLIEEDKEFINLKASSILGEVQAFSGQAVRFLLTVAYTVILARLLTPWEYGLFIMALIIGVFFFNFRDLGLIPATVQSQSSKKKT